VPGGHVARPGLRASLRKARRRVAQPLIGSGGVALVRRLSRTWKLEFGGLENFPLHPEQGGRLVALWHGRLLVGVEAHSNRGYQVLVSPSGDGELMHKLLREFGYGTLRGSSSRGGTRALREMLRDLKAARTVVVTPDGPRGPMHSMNMGLAWMARASGHPIVPIGFGVDRAWRLKSWDRCTVPKPFARVRICYGEPIPVARDADEATLTAVTERVRESLLELERGAAEALGVAP
jgi:lysophospholipid acyltransferase (LPLAT)-like uncharacterized protein